MSFAPLYGPATKVKPGPTSLFNAGPWLPGVGRRASMHRARLSLGKVVWCTSHPSLSLIDIQAESWYVGFDYGPRVCGGGRPLTT